MVQENWNSWYMVIHIIFVRSICHLKQQVINKVFQTAGQHYSGFYLCKCKAVSCSSTLISHLAQNLGIWVPILEGENIYNLSLLFWVRICCFGPNMPFLFSVGTPFAHESAIKPQNRIKKTLGSQHKKPTKMFSFFGVFCLFWERGYPVLCSC